MSYLTASWGQPDNVSEVALGSGIEAQEERGKGTKSIVLVCKQGRDFVFFVFPSLPWAKTPYYCHFNLSALDMPPSCISPKKLSLVILLPTSP